MADEVQLFGEGGYGTILSVPYVRLNQYQALHSGDVTSIRFESGYEGLVKVAIYADDSDSPSELLATSSPNAYSFGVNVIPITYSGIISGMKYWIGYISSNGGVTNISGGSLAKSASYADYEFPGTAGEGWLTRTYGLRLSAWGTLASGGAGRLIGGKSRLIGGPSPLIGGPSPFIG